MSTTVARASSRPAIRLSEADLETLSDLAVAVEARLPDVSAMLLREIERATVLPVERMAPDIVRMGSTVEFVDDGTGRRRSGTLVYPAQADIEADRISILTPIGAGLIGLREGQSIAWPDREGETHVLHIVKVTQPK